MSIEPFGQFLLSKKQSPGALGELAEAAARDPGFPRQGGAKEISQRLNSLQAPPEFHEALEEAEAEWRSANP